ncbi:MAG: DUF998 domain-containing protein [Myxococcota bacterium]
MSGGAARSRALSIAGASGVGAAALALVVPLLGGMARPGYDACAQYISELGESGAADAAWVNLGGFLPIGVLSVGFACIAARFADGWRARVGLSLASGVGFAYLLAAFFPCDPGCPSPGSATQQIHSSGALAEYLGGGAGILLASGARVRGAALAPRWLAFTASAIALAAFAGMLAPALQPARGLVQRSAELALFAWLFVAARNLQRAVRRQASPG